jgi:CBS domain-containing protein
MSTMKVAVMVRVAPAGTTPSAHGKVVVQSPVFDTNTTSAPLARWCSRRARSALRAWSAQDLQLATELATVEFDPALAAPDDLVGADGVLVGIVTNRDLRFETRFDIPVSEVMTPQPLVTVPVGTTIGPELGGGTAGAGRGCWAGTDGGVAAAGAGGADFSDSTCLFRF